MGSGGHFGIWIDSDLLHGSSGTSGTFSNPCLCTPPLPPAHESAHAAESAGHHAGQAADYATDRASRDSARHAADQPSGAAPEGSGGTEGPSGVREAEEDVFAGEFVCDVFEIWGLDEHAIKRRNVEMERRGVAP